MKRVIKLYFDYKSPYSYLAKAHAYELEQEFDVAIEWKPFIFDIANAYGDLESRNNLQWHKVKYLYLDARRLAAEQNIIIKGPKKLFDSSLAAKGMYFAAEHGIFRAYHDAVFEKFFLRELDIENIDAIQQLIASLGADMAKFAETIDGPATEALAQSQREGEADCIFGVPTFVYHDEPFWGADRLRFLKEKLL